MFDTKSSKKLQVTSPPYYAFIKRTTEIQKIYVFSKIQKHGTKKQTTILEVIK